MEKSQLYAELAIALENEILEALEIDCMSSTKVLSSCPVHCGDNETAFNYCFDKHRWVCWTQHCEKEHGGDLIGLIKGIRQCSFSDACNFIDKLNNGIVIDPDTIDLKRFIRASKANAKSPAKSFDIELFNKLDHNVSYFINRGYKLDTLHAFKAFQCKKDLHPLKGRACLPIFKDNAIIGFTGRATDNTMPKWQHYPSKIETSETFFGINLAEPFIRETGVAILTEGPLDVMRMYELKFPFTVATLGLGISLDQIKILLRLGVKSVILGLDPDLAGDSAAIKWRKKLEQFFKVSELELTCDPGKLTSGEQILPQIRKVLEEVKMRYHIGM